MRKVKVFLKNHALWIGLIAVVVPVVAHLGLQYRSLSELETTMPWARRALMRKYLQELTRDVTRVYRRSAEEVLAVPASGFTPETTSELAEHFRTHRFKGARRLFVGMVDLRNDRTYATILFFNPETSHLEREPNSQEWRAAHAGAATWIAMIMTKSTAVSDQLSVDERDPNNRIIVKPILDKWSNVIGVAGMIVDERVFREVYFPEAIRTTLRKAYPEEMDEVIITLMDSREKIIFSNQTAEGKEPEAGGSFPFIFTDYYLGIRMRDLTENQLARRYFLVNFSLSILASLLLLGGAVLALRTASRALRLSQMKADFVSNVSHELRTPLASIRVFGEFLKLGRVKDPEKTQEYGAYIETESRRLTQLIDNILDFSKIESGQKTYRFEQAHLPKLIDETLNLFVVRLEQSGFRITFETPSDALPEAHLALLDGEAIAQAFINLLDNAVKYSGKSREITVRIGAEGPFLTVTVADSGIGMERDELEKIFDKFYRVSTGLVHDVKGSGLGLSIVKHVAEAHRGKVTVESTPGRGTAFTIWLPNSGHTAGLRSESATGDPLKVEGHGARA
ncbi:MAG: ATP-binding protein [Acidobacteriota bacterium]